MYNTINDFIIKYPNTHKKFKIGYEKHIDFYTRGEPQTFKYFIDTIKKDWNIIDVGANIGMMTLLFDELTDGKIFAIEASDINYNMLTQNVASYNKGNITTKCCCISNKTQECEGDIHYLWTGFNPTGTHTGLKQFITLDDLFDNCDVKINLLKIDIDGWDFEALQGSVNLMKKHSPIIIVELVPWALCLHNHKIETVISFLNNNGYTFKAQLDNENYVFEK